MPTPIYFLSRAEAEKCAFRLVAYSSAIFPNLNEQSSSVYVDIADIAVLFAINARRCLDMQKSDPEITFQRWSYEHHESRVYETNLRRALNGIIHAEDVTVSFNDSPEILYDDADNKICPFLSYKTDRYPKTFVDIFGMAWAFLNTTPLEE